MNRVTLADRLWWTLRKRWSIMAAVLPGVALALAHSTMLNVPSADFVDALDTDHYRIHWISGSYLLGSALGMALTGFCSSRLGLRGAYLLGVLLFTLAGAACGLVTEIVWMTPLRWFEGLGNGLLISVGMVLIWCAFPRGRKTAMALYGMAVYVPAVAGTLIGGMLTAWLSWRWIFFIDFPLGTVVFAMASMLLPREPRPEKQSWIKLDLVGLALLAGSIITLNVVLDLGQYWGWATSRHFVIWLVGFLAACGAFVCWGLMAQAIDQFARLRSTEHDPGTNDQGDFQHQFVRAALAALGVHDQSARLSVVASGTGGFAGCRNDDAGDSAGH